jgi:hypothetical protein
MKKNQSVNNLFARLLLSLSSLLYFIRQLIGRESKICGEMAQSVIKTIEF